MIIYYNTWWYMILFDDLWWYKMACDNIRPYTIAYDNTSYVFLGLMMINGFTGEAMS